MSAMVKKSSSKTKGKNAAKEVGQLAFMGFSLVAGTSLFYFLLIIGLICVIGVFFDPSNIAGGLLIGIGFIAASLIVNLLTVRITEGHWKIRWLSYPGA